MKRRPPAVRLNEWGIAVALLLDEIPRRHPELVRLAGRIVWCSYMMHVYDGYNAHEVPR